MFVMRGFCWLMFVTDPVFAFLRLVLVLRGWGAPVFLEMCWGRR
jgi:hypothetical protein